MSFEDPLSTDSFQGHAEFNQQFYPAPSELKQSNAMIPTSLDGFWNSRQSPSSATSQTEQAEQAAPNPSRDISQAADTTSMSLVDMLDLVDAWDDSGFGSTSSGVHSDQQVIGQNANGQLSTVDVNHIMPSPQTQNGTQNQQGVGQAASQQRSGPDFCQLNTISSGIVSFSGVSSHQHVSRTTGSHQAPNVTSGLHSSSYMSNNHCTSVSTVGQHTLGGAPNMASSHHVSGVPNQQLLSGSHANYQHSGINLGDYAPGRVSASQASSTATFTQAPISNGVTSQQVQSFSAGQQVSNAVTSHQLPARNLATSVYTGQRAFGTVANQQTRPISSPQFVSRSSYNHLPDITTSQLASGVQAAGQYASTATVHQQFSTQNTVFQPSIASIHQTSTGNASYGASAAAGSSQQASALVHQAPLPNLPIAAGSSQQASALVHQAPLPNLPTAAGSSQQASALVHQAPLPNLPTVLDDNTPTEERHKKKAGRWTFMFFWALLEVQNKFQDGPSLVVWKDKARLLFQVTRCSTKTVSELWSTMEGSPHRKGGTWNNLTARVKYSLTKDEGFFKPVNPGKVPFPRSFTFGENIQERIKRGCVNEGIYQKLTDDLRDALRTRNSNSD